MSQTPLKLVTSQDAPAAVAKLTTFTLAHAADGKLMRATFNGQPVTLPELLCSLTLMLAAGSPQRVDEDALVEALCGAHGRARLLADDMGGEPESGLA